MLSLRSILAGIFLVASMGFAANPFIPPENVQLFYQVIYPDPSAPKFDYKMYMRSQGKMIALINGKFVSEGDSIDSMKVISINERRVILVNAAGEKRAVVIDSMQSQLQRLRAMMDEGKS